jgi:hypothetical protein
MAAADTKFLTTINKGGESVFLLKFNDCCRAFGDAYPVSLTFFMIHG